MFNHYSRENKIQALAEEEYDLLIVGGGITGAGVARDAASRGLKVLLLEANDFAFGTSSRSSKLVHGGIRYLENFEFSLVHEALMERKNLLRMAPHMVHPLRFLIPIYKTSRVGLLKMEAGMILYDLLSFFEAPQIHEMHFSQSTLRREPLIRSEGLTGSVVYSDAYMEDDRLVIETLRSAENMGATSLSYMEVKKVQEGASGVSLELFDKLKNRTITVKGKHMVGCLGPWTDLFSFKNVKNWKSVLRPTKGVHIIFRREDIPVQQVVVMAVEERIVFVIPRGEIVIVGTTDTDFTEDPAKVLVTREDVDYLLGVTKKYFPSLQLGRENIISCYAGVRPLVRDQAGSEGKTSREHEIFEEGKNITLVAGGKYTTYRAMAEEIVESALRAWSFEERMALKKPATVCPLNSLATEEKIQRLMTLANELSEEFQLSEKMVKMVVCRRGEEALGIFRRMNLLAKEESEEERLWQAEAKFCIENEMCMHLTDFYLRRTPLFLFYADHGLTYLPRIAHVFAAALSWSEDEKKKQIQSLQDLLAKELQSLEHTSAAH